MAFSSCSAHVRLTGVLSTRPLPSASEAPFIPAKILLGPEALSADAGIAPYEVLGVPLLIVDHHLLRRPESRYDRHDPSNRILVSVLDELQRVLAEPDELRWLSEIEVLGAGGRMRLRALVTRVESVRRFLRHLGEPTEPPALSPARDPPFWKSRVLRRYKSLAPEQVEQVEMFGG